MLRPHPRPTPAPFERPHPEHSPPACSPSGAGSASSSWRLGGAAPVRSWPLHPTSVATQGRGAPEPAFLLLSCFSPPFNSSHLPALSFSLPIPPSSWASHSGPSSENRDLKASSLREIPVPGRLEEKAHGEESLGHFPQMLTSSQLYCAPTVCQAHGWHRVPGSPRQLAALQARSGGRAGGKQEISVGTKGIGG